MSVLVVVVDDLDSVSSMEVLWEEVCDSVGEWVELESGVFGEAGAEIVDGVV